MNIYLAGGMQGGWSDQLRNFPWLYDINWLDPRDWAEDCPTPRDYTARDLAEIRSADLVVAHMDSSNPSGYGMSFEVGYAVALGKPVVYWDGMDGDWRDKYFGMIRSTAIPVASLNQVVSAVEGFFERRGYPAK
jgi:hypothetical protein